MIIPCFIVLTLGQLGQQQIAVNAKRIEAIYKEGSFAVYTTVQVNNRRYSVKESVSEVKELMKKECK